MVTLSKVRRGGIYWVDFEPVRGSEQGKIRPAVVIQNNIGNLRASTTIVLPITSQIPSKQYPVHVRLPNGTLDKPGVIMCEQIRTVSLDRVDPRLLAECSEDTMAEVERAISHSLGFSEETAGL